MPESTRGDCLTLVLQMPIRGRLLGYDWFVLARYGLQTGTVACGEGHLEQAPFHGNLHDCSMGDLEGEEQLPLQRDCLNTQLLEAKIQEGYVNDGA